MSTIKPRHVVVSSLIHPVWETSAFPIPACHAGGEAVIPVSPQLALGTSCSVPERKAMIVLGVILIILGALLDVGILYQIGAVLAVIGIVLWLFGAFGRQLGPRAHYW